MNRKLVYYEEKETPFKAIFKSLFLHGLFPEYMFHVTTDKKNKKSIVKGFEYGRDRKEVS